MRKLKDSDLISMGQVLLDGTVTELHHANKGYLYHFYADEWETLSRG